MAVNFKQKEFFLPALANFASVVGTGAQLVDSGYQKDAEERQLEQQKKTDAINLAIANKSNEYQQKQTDATNELANAIKTQSPTATTPPTNTTAATRQVANVLSTSKPAVTKSYSVIKYRRKRFSTTTPKTGVGESLSSIVGGGMSMVGAHQTHQQLLQTQQGLQQTIEANNQRTAALKNQLKNMENATTDLQTAVTGFQKSYSEQSTIKFRQKNYAFLGKVGGLIDRWNKSGAGRTVNGLGKVTRDVVRDNRGMLLGGVAMGAGTAVVGYGVNKGLQAKMKKDGIDMNAITKFQQDQQQQYANERQYSDPATTAASETGKKEVFDKFGNRIFQKQGWGRAGEIAAHYGKEAVGPLSIGFTAMFEAPKVGGYFGERNKLKALSDMARANQGLAPLPSALQAKPRKPGEQPGVVKMAGPGQAPMGQQPSRPSRQQRNYSAVGNWFKGVVNGAVNGVRGFGHAVRTQGATGVLDFTSKHLAQGGGFKGVSRFGNRLIETGKQNNSQFLQKAGNFIKNNPKTALAASIPVGFGAMSYTFEKGEDMIKKPMEKIDPNAYAYEKFKESQIQ